MSTTRVKPILRLKKRAQFADIPLALKNAIAKNLNVEEWREDNFEIKEIAQDEKYSQHYLDRIDSINDGIKFLLDSYKDIFPLGNSLKTYLDEVANECKE